MYKFIWLYNEIETYVIVGGVAFFIYQLVIEFCKGKTKKILKIAYGLLFVLILLLSMLGIDDKIKKPDMNESLYDYAKSVVLLVDAAANNNMPLDSLKDIINGYASSYAAEKPSAERTELEQEIYSKILSIYGIVEFEYSEEFGGVESDEYGYPFTWHDISDYTKDDIIEVRDELAEMIKLPPHYNEDDFERYDKLSYFD
ncbi:MAG: hypothetical protein IIW48_10040 [Clostridia bacterium]|nr:hypothetical protein [Clostridia bacterium]